MGPEGNYSQPIYLQIRDRVRAVATESSGNPLTVLKAYQQLTDEDLIEKRRGLGMFVKVGARDRLLGAEREKFLSEQWPEIHATIQRLGLADELLGQPSRRGED